MQPDDPTGHRAGSPAPGGTGAGADTVLAALAHRLRARSERQQLLTERLRSGELRPGALADLAELAAAARRGARDGDHILVMAGADVPDRGSGGGPVPLGQALSAAVSTSEAASRTVVPPTPSVSLTPSAGPVVAQILSELLAHATSATGPGERLELHSRWGPDGGLVVELLSPRPVPTRTPVDELDRMLAAGRPDGPVAPQEIGLYLAARLARAIGGRLGVRGSPGVASAPGPSPVAVLQLPPSALAGTRPAVGDDGDARRSGPSEIVAVPVAPGPVAEPDLAPAADLDVAAAPVVEPSTGVVAAARTDAEPSVPPWPPAPLADTSGVVANGTAPYGAVSTGVNGPAPNGPIGNGPSQNGPAQGSPSLNGPAQNGPAQGGPAQGSPSLNGPAQNGLTQGGPVPSGPVPNGPVPNGPVQGGPTPYGTSQQGPAQHGPTPHGPGTNGIPANGLTSNGLPPRPYAPGTDAGSPGASTGSPDPASGPVARLPVPPAPSGPPAPPPAPPERPPFPFPPYGPSGAGPGSGGPGSGPGGERPAPPADVPPVTEALPVSGSTPPVELFGPFDSEVPVPVDDLAGTPIFAAVASAWFRDPDAAPKPPPGPQAPGTNGHRPPPEPANWTSAGDAEFEAARSRADRVVQPPVTAHGLPVRRPGQQMVPPSRRDDPAAARRVPSSAERQPDRVRNRLASYQRGLREGRHRAAEESADLNGAASPGRNGHAAG